MKKFAIFTLTLALGTSMLVGCGCMNTGSNVTTLPTNGETVTPTTHVTTAPTTMPTTHPTTEAPTEHTTEHNPGAATEHTGIGNDVVGGSTDDATGATEGTDMGRSRSRVIPRG